MTTCAEISISVRRTAAGAAGKVGKSRNDESRERNECRSWHVMKRIILFTSFPPAIQNLSGFWMLIDVRCSLSVQMRESGTLICDKMGCASSKAFWAWSRDRNQLHHPRRLHINTIFMLVSQYCVNLSSEIRKWELMPSSNSRIESNQHQHASCQAERMNGVPPQTRTFGG
jgi:hypothetical protein